MQEFSSISVSSYEAAALADRLTEQSSEGWNLVSIVPTGSTITAYLSRPAAAVAADADDESTAEPTAPVAEAAAVAVVAEVVTEEAAAEAPAEPTEAPAEAAPEPAVETPVVEQPAAAAPAEAASAVAAGWYADPSSRFELRYWDGSQWTEHVSRGGQQFTDPPVA